MLIMLGAADAPAARSFYQAVLDLDPQVYPVDEPVPDYRGFVLTYIVDQPSGVRSVLDTAVRHGATVLKPAKKALFAGFSAVFRAPDGTVWKLASAQSKDTGPATTKPVPSETGVLLGVAATKASAAFHQAVDLTVDRDYGSKYIDFKPAATGSRLGLMDAKVLAKDAGVKTGDTGLPAATFVRAAASRAEVDSLLAAADAGGGRVVEPAAEAPSGEYAGRFADPDGFLWQVTSV